LQMYYAEALRLISAQQKLQEILSSLQKEVFDAYITNPIKAQLPEAFAFADAPSFMANLHIVLELLHPFKDDPGIHQSLYYMDKIEATAGYADLDRSDYRAATYHFENKLNLALIIDDNLSKRIAYHALGLVQSRLGKKGPAMKLYQKALGIAGSMGDRYGYAKVLSDIGILQRQACDYKGAIQSYQKSLEMAIITGNKIQQEIILYNFGELYYQQNDLEKAEEYYYQSLDLAEKLNDNVGVSYATDAIGDLYYSKGEIDKAEKLYLANFERQTAIDDAEGLAHTYGNLANVAKARNQFDLANDYYTRNLALCQRVGDLDGEGRSWYNSAALEYDMENYSSAMEKLLQAERCFTEAGSAVYMDMLHELMDQCRAKMQ
ncbi:MAG: tetratricopeptide repeat protein, partial [Candidatus Cloacimonadaceae bacterium]|nr:tetratricopeptide repeat protein [Candidatus Cloacimonadaceae bacterium]